MEIVYLPGNYMSRIQIIALVIAALMTLALLQLIRKKKLKEQYSLLWFLTILVVIALAIWEPLLGRISSLLGIAVPSNALFLMALAFLFAMALHFSLLVSRLTDQSKMLAQKLAILERDLRKARERNDDGERGPGETDDAS
jgi:hypothetical protein